MNIYWSSAEKRVRRGFWLTIALACLALLSTLVNPLVGPLAAILFFLLAWGIRRGQAGAAWAAAGIVVLPVVAVLLRWRELSSAPGAPVAVISIAIQLLCAWFLLHAALAMQHDSNASHVAWPWAALVVVVGAPWFCLHPYVMPTGSMAGTLLAGDYLLTESVSPHLGRMPGRDALVVFRYPVDRRQTFIKRVAGIPGDRIQIRNKQLYRNGSPVAEPYAIHTTSYVDDYRDNFPAEPNTRLNELAMEMLQKNVRAGEVVVPEGKYFVLGDNRDSSLDSRYWGFVSAGDILGTPLLIYGSNDLGDKGPGETAPSILNTRWNRLLKRL